MKSTKILLATGSAMLLASGALRDQARAATDAGTAIGDLLSMPAQSVSELTRLAANDVQTKPATLLAAATRARSDAAQDLEAQAPQTGEVPLSSLMAGEATSFNDLIATTLHAGDDAAAAPSAKIATTLPKTPKSAPKKADVTVRVVIGEDPKKAPAAEKMATAKALASKPATTAAAVVLEIEETATGLKFKPETLVLPKAGVFAAIKLKGTEESLALFLRDEQVASLDRVSHKIKGLKPGVTELYAVANGKMFIVPVKVEDGANSKWDLKVPDALTSLSGLFGEQLQSANFQGERPAASAPKAAADDDDVTADLDADGQSLQAATADTLRADAADAVRLKSQFVAASADLKYHAVPLQLIDERSSATGDRLYPIGHAQLRLVGTEFSARSDDSGKLTIRDMPANAHFLAAIDDPNGGARPAMAEIDTKADGKGTQRIRLMRQFTFDAYAEAAGTVQNEGLGSLCANVTDLVEGVRVAAANIAIELDTTAEGPFYFNQYGLLDQSMRGTGADGRVCFFNVAPGPIAVTAYEGEAAVATIPVAAFAGRHVEEDLALGKEQALITRLASVATAHEQLSADAAVSGRLQSVDMIDLIALGQTNPMEQLASGLVQTSDAVLDAHGRVHAFAQAAEFEPTVYSYPAGSRSSVTPLIPRGFVEDMSIYAQVSHDPALGVVVADYAHPATATDQAVSMHLVDQFGQDVGDGWYYSDAPNTKAIFFNVPAGTYTLLIETKDQYWLAADIVTVYTETVSYSRMGAGLVYRP